MRILIVIPARGGSKSICNKNLAPVGGKPLIDWTLELLPQLYLPDFSAVVSTDSELIAAHCVRKGVAVLERPDYLATDDSSTLAVLQHAIADRTDRIDAVLCLQPTNPLRTKSDISAAYRIMEKTGCDSVLSFVQTSWRERVLQATFKEGGAVVPMEPSTFRPRQKFEPAFKRTGEIYLIKREAIEAGSMTGDDCSVYIIPRERAWNIDDPCDIPIVEGLLKFNGRL